jgi:hypothetical protein
VRVGFGDREAATEALVSHLVAGRLSLTEFEQRAQDAAQARTRAELSALFDDLPLPHGTSQAEGRGWASLPDDLRRAVTEEGLAAVEEDLTGSITYRHYCVGRLQVRRRRIPVVGAIAVSRSRLIVWTSGAKHVDVPFTHPLWLAMTITRERSNVLRISYRAESFRSDRSGRVDVRFTTDRAPELVRLISRLPPGRADS